MTPKQVAKLRHNLTNPVSHILGFAEMLLEQTSPGEKLLKADLERIRQLGGQMIACLNRALPKSRLLAVPIDLPSLRIQIQDLANSVLRTTQSVLRRVEIGAQPLPALQEDLRRVESAARDLFQLSETELAVPPSILPSTPEEKAAGASGAVKTSRSSEHHSPPQQPSILVVDDLLEIREQLQTRLARLGYKVHAVENGLAALQFLEANPVHIILLDFAMPALDGFETLKRLKSNPVTQNIPVLMLTFAETADQLSRCRALGAKGFLAKPFQDRLLREKIEFVLGKRGQE